MLNNDSYEELKAPYISDELIEYIKESYTIDDLMYTANMLSNAEEKIGFIRGVLFVINALKAIHEEQKER